ncbi:MAG: hypothetical protein IH991_05610, partial [Planctomycetes bacterium]|nr:hypothetical protein [Planctomycetota bacterium]
FGKGSETTIMLFVGEGSAFVSGKAPRPFEITDDTANVILLVRAGSDKSVPWTKPVDVSFDSEDPLASLGEIPDTGIDVAMFDFRVRTLPKNIDAATLRKLIEPNDGEPVDLDKLDRSESAQ